MTFEVFHFEISGILFNFEHPPKIYSIFVTLDISQLEISGKDNNELQSQKMTHIFNIRKIPFRNIRQ